MLMQTLSGRRGLGGALNSPKVLTEPDSVFVFGNVLDLVSAGWMVGEKVQKWHDIGDI
jgi:hypothetical protein